MSSTISPVIKGLITALAMIAVTFGLYYSNQPAYSPLQYTPYAVYGIGIVWTLISYKRSESFTGKFGDLFLQGFRCFIVVTLVMVVFIAVFLKVQPKFREEGAEAYRVELVKAKNKTPQEIDTEVAKYKEQFNTGFISASIFGYLVVGAIITAGTAVFLTKRKQ
jgi:hypothetical protein